MVSINFIIYDEINAMKFGFMSEAYDFYYMYGKCKDFVIRKNKVRQIGPGDSEMIVMRQYVCNKHGLRDKKHLSWVDGKKDH